MFNAMKLVEHGHELVVLANLMPMDEEVVEADSWMIQTVGHEVVHALSDCLGLPMVRRKTKAKSVRRGMGYKPARGDEVCCRTFCLPWVVVVVVVVVMVAAMVCV